MIVALFDENHTYLVPVNGRYDVDEIGIIIAAIINATDVHLIDPSTITCEFDLTGAETGAWDVVLTNSDGQFSLLSGEFSIQYLPPLVTAITPSSGKNNEVVGITNLAGSGFRPGATVVLKKSSQADIPTINSPIVNPDKILCVFDLSGRKGGSWDVVVTNDDGQFSSLDDGFTVFYPQPPTVTGITPESGQNTGPVSITDLAGTGFQTGATIALKKAGQPDIPGTDVNVISPSRITGQLNITGAMAGDWTVVVTNDDGQVSNTVVFTYTPGVANPPTITSPGSQAGQEGQLAAVNHHQGAHDHDDDSGNQAVLEEICV